jgi:hypothetical protein
MKKMVIVLTLLSISCSASMIPGKKSKPKMSVQLYAIDMQSEATGSFVQAYLIFPDGTRATAVCGQAQGQATCNPESFNPERRSPTVCSTPQSKNVMRCVYQENYPADRDGNDVHIHAANGTSTFHIVGSWDLDSFNKMPAPAPMR